jgi:DinB superfamily
LSYVAAAVIFSGRVAESPRREGDNMFERELRLNGLMNGYLARLLADFDDSQLEQPIVTGGNPPAWILAHLAVANDYALRMLGEPRLAPAEWHKRFGPGRSPREDPNPLPSKMELAEKLTNGHQALAAAVPKADPERMNEPQTVEFFKGTPVETIGDVVAHLLATHLAMHLGQLSAWRRAQGRPVMF